MDYGKCTGLISCACHDHYARTVRKLREADGVSRQLRETAIRLIALKFDVPEREVIHSLQR